MAIYHKHLKYHEDTVEKHAITEEEVKFLLQLQKEMNTQDTVAQADPRFWVIKGSEKEYGIEAGYEDGAELKDDDFYTLATDMESAMEYIRDNILEKINETDGIKRKISLIDGFFHPSIKISWTDDDNEEDWIELENMNDVDEWLRSQGIACQAAYYKIEDKIYPNTLFLTQKAAEEHLKNNNYHYSNDAHTYAMTSWRCPETEKLWQIIQRVDWSTFLPDAGKVSES